MAQVGGFSTPDRSRPTPRPPFQAEGRWFEPGTTHGFSDGVASGNALVLEFLVVLRAPLLLVALRLLELLLGASSILGGLTGGVLALLRRTHHSEAEDEQQDGGNAEDDP